MEPAWDGNFLPRRGINYVGNHHVTIWLRFWHFGGEDIKTFDILKTTGVINLHPRANLFCRRISSGRCSVAAAVAGPVVVETRRPPRYQREEPNGGG